MTDRLVLGVDLAFRNTGLVLAKPCLADPGYTIVATHCITTEKADKKKQIFAAIDDVRCIQEVVRELQQFIGAENISVIFAECPNAGAKGARANRAMGIATAILATYVEMEKISTLWVLPDDIKKKLCGKRNASKEEIQSVVMKVWPDAAWPKAKGKLEHVADAAGALIVGRDSDIYKLLLQESKNA